jgi:cytochrome c biogenesis protein CcmG/thiol:disulfide interchange protein DsbE
MRYVLYALPGLAFVILAAFFMFSLIRPAPETLPSVLVDKPAPQLTLPALDASTTGFGPKELKSGHVTVINVWASWCIPCGTEAPQLAALSKTSGIALFGLVYKDTPAKARAFLKELGNPFSRIGLDSDGRAAIEWGVYGVPETFIVDGKGIVRERFVGPITDDSLHHDILPAIARAGS